MSLEQAEPTGDHSHPSDSHIVSHNVTLLQRLLNDPDNKELLRESASQLYVNPVSFAKAAKAVIPSRNHEHKDEHHLPVARDTWKNSIGNQVCRPLQIIHPKSLQDLKDAVKQAQTRKVPLRAVGSGHSFSDVAVTDGILLDPQHMNQVLAVDSSVLRDARQISSHSQLFSVQSGITIAKLNQELDARNLALINMGAYDGQSLAGAISTGTHGTGAGLGPLASSVRSLVLVSETGTIYLIEPRSGITDPDKFAAKQHGHDAGVVVLKQDDDWFQSNVVAMGCMGVIYSYTLEVVPAYYLAETRVEASWEDIKLTLVPPPAHESNSLQQLPAVITQHRHFEIDINPYAVDGKHRCIVTTRDIHPEPHQRSGSRGSSTWLSGLVANVPLLQDIFVDFLNLVPKLTPYIVSSALDTLVDTNYVDKSYNVLNLGNVNELRTYAVELSFPGRGFVESIDKLLGVFARARDEHGWYQTGPIGVRFVQAADAYLAPQYGRVTCMAECDMFDGIKHGQDLLRYVEKTMLSGGGDGVRVHWGLDLDAVSGEEVQKVYEKYRQWLVVYRQLNASGMFNNRLTDRIGISVK